MNDILLEMRNVTKRFPGVVALKDVSIELKKGEILGICGENGAGKTTLMKVLSGSFQHHEYDGHIIIDGKPVRFDSVASAQKHGIEMVYQELNIVLDISVAENLFINDLPSMGMLVDFKTLYRKTEEILKQIDINISPKMKARMLNSGQIQLLSLMRACVKKPRILVLDEPTSALTNSEVDILMKVLENLRENGISSIYISHKLDEIYRICDRVLTIRDGQVIACHEVKKIKQNVLIEEMVGRKIEDLYPKDTHKIGKEIMRVDHLSVPHPNIERKYIVNDISFGLREGEILGIGGLVGSGRSEALGAIFGQLTKGVTKEITIKGKRVEINSPQDAIRAGIGFLTEERKLNGIVWMLNIRENLVLPSLHELPGKVFMNLKVEREKTINLFEQLKIKAPSIETKVVSLSGGNQQKVILGKWLLKNPMILLIDEPTKGIDVGTKAAFYSIMNELTKTGMSIVMVSSDMPELVSMSDRCLVLNEGIITAELQREEINEINIMKNCI